MNFRLPAAWAAAPVVVPMLLLAGVPAAPQLPLIALSDNLAPAGRLAGGEFSLALEIRRGRWHPLGENKPGVELLAFAEAGKAPTNPGPMIRVPLGTAMRITVTNTSRLRLVVRGLAARRVAAMDSLVLAPGETRESRFVADAPGTYYYWAAAPGERMAGVVLARRRADQDSQLNGAFIVDGPGARPAASERVMVVSLWWPRDTAGLALVDDGLFAINGRPWPHTERLSYTMGDSVHWRFINASSDVHPFHLHGFYYRVDARGDLQQDSVYWPAQQRMAVTERLDEGQTMDIAWSPSRPGGWVFHCHFPIHMIPNAGLGPDRLPTPAREHEIYVGHPDHEPQHHLERGGMGGLMLAVSVRPAPGWKPFEGVRRTLRLLIQSDSTAADSLRRFGYIVQAGAEPRPDSVPWPSATVVLHRDEPTLIRVINRSGEPTAVHWHGLEIESPFDGVVGVGGYPGSPTPPIMPGDSFDVRVTPPRSGSFMYHTHVNDVRQLRAGLYAPLVVLEPGEVWDPARDLVFQVGQTQTFAPALNGHANPAPVRLTAGKPYRIRLMNIAVFLPGVHFSLVADSTPIPRWRPLARDGFDLPAWQREPRVADEPVSIGQTADFAFTAPAAGSLALELRSGAGRLLVRQPFTVVRP